MSILLVLGRLSTFQASHFNGKRKYRLGRGSVAARMLGLRVRIPTGEWLAHSLSSACAFSEEVPATDRSLIQRSPTESVCVCVCVCVSLSVIR